MRVNGSRRKKEKSKKTSLCARQAERTAEPRRPNTKNVPRHGPRPTAHGVAGSVELDGDDGSRQDWLEMEKLRSPPTPWPLPESAFSPTSTAEADWVTPSHQGPRSSSDSHHPLSISFFAFADLNRNGTSLLRTERNNRLAARMNSVHSAVDVSNKRQMLSCT